MARHLSSSRLSRYVYNLLRWMNKTWHATALFGAICGVTPMCTLGYFGKMRWSKIPQSTAFLKKTENDNSSPKDVVAVVRVRRLANRRQALRPMRR